MNLHIGIRQNNVNLVQSARHAFRGTFHGRNHRFYSSIEIHVTLMRQLCPPPVKAILEQHESLSKRGDHSKGQGFDFILEEVYADTKAWIPRGVPDVVTCCQHLPNLKQIKFILQMMSGARLISDGLQG